MKDKSYETITIGFVGHCPILALSEIKTTIEKIPSFKLVFFKTSSGKLWIQEGDNNE